MLPADLPTDVYVWGDRTLETHRCRECACVSHWVAMAKLEVSGNFLITIGYGAGPSTNVVISVTDQDGKPKLLHFSDLDGGGDEQPVQISLVLSARFGLFTVDLRIVRIIPMPTGFYGFWVEPPYWLGYTLDKTRPSVPGIVVDDGTDRGQALACSCGGAEMTPWFAERTETPGEG